MKLRQLFLPAIAATLLVSFTPSYSAQPDSIVTTEGRLGDLLAAKKLKSATQLVIAGSLNDADFEVLRQMRNLTHLDISQTDLAVLPDDAFRGCDNLETIVLPNNLKSISRYAFFGCSALTSIVIPKGVTSIEKKAFSYRSSLTSIVIPESVTSIEEGAFWNCSSLTSITISPQNTTYTDIDGVLYSKDGKTLIAYPAGKIGASYVIQSGATSIESWAFYECSSLTSVVIPEGVTSIGEEAFYGCHALTSIVISEGVTSIEGRAFSSCRALTSIAIPEGVTSIGYGAFDGCSSLTSISVSPDNSAYKDIDGVLHSKDGKTLIVYPADKPDASYVIQSGVTEIWQWAFSNCRALTSVVIPKSVTSIGEKAFYGCSSLTSIVIPQSVTSIGESAFSNCRALTSIIIPDGVTSIEWYAFSGCSALTKVTCLATTPPELGLDAFDSLGKAPRELAVPAGSVKAYENDEDWRSYFKHIKAIQEN